VSDTTEALSRQISGASDLQSVVRTMKALAASSIGQYEQSVRALADYYRTVELALRASLREYEPISPSMHRKTRINPGMVDVFVFGSDQGLVGQFNDVVADYAVKAMGDLPGKCRVCAVGERVQARLVDAGLDLVGCFPVPKSVQGITALVGQVLADVEARHGQGDHASLWVFHNRPLARSLFEPIGEHLLPLEKQWQRDRAKMVWPTANLPQVVGNSIGVLRAVIREYLFISLFRACAESLASENASRLAAMERAEKNIDELLEQLRRSFHQLRQSGIDEELFDVISGFEALGGAAAP
jgi:F-type H+-transporting ATPase subunit gamma